jgi:hypothetical protein
VINILDKRLDKIHQLLMDHNRLVPQSARAGGQSSVRKEAARARSGLVCIHNS